MGNEDVKVTAMNMYKYKGKVTFYYFFVFCFFVFLLKWTKSEKEVIYGKKSRGHRAFKRVKSLPSSHSQCHVMA